MGGSGTDLSITSSATITTNTGYKIVGAADFSKDNQPDLLVEQIATSTDPLEKVTREIWHLNGTSVSSTKTFLTFAQEWFMVGVGDYDQDGHIDVMVGQTTGRRAIWYMTYDEYPRGICLHDLAACMAYWM